MRRVGFHWMSSLLLLATLAGCLAPDDPVAPDATTALPELVPIVTIQPENLLGFSQSVVTPAVGLAADLYEPTMEVSDTGAIYVAGHVIGAATTGTPAYISTDDGQTWRQLPFVANVEAPSPIQGAQPPPGDEGFIVAGANGQAWMVDIYLAGFSITGWCGDGAEMCYDNRQAYDRTATITAPCMAQASLNDRPWGAYANDTLLLVNNPGGGPMQIGVMPVPPATPVGGSDPVTGPTWNLCASPGGGIPGIPAMRDDGFFAVPQMYRANQEADQWLNVVTGNSADIFDVQVRPVFPIENSYGGTSNGGRTAFGLDGTLFVGAYNNTDYDRATQTVQDDVRGRFILATSTDDGESFVNVTFEAGSPVRSLYLDSNMAGPGALLTWSQLGETPGRSDWYVAHVFVGPSGEPQLRHVSLAVDEGPHSSAHVMGAASGPDGRAYFVNFEQPPSIPAGGVGPVPNIGAPNPEYTGSTPISVWIQQDGPTLPVG